WRLSPLMPLNGGMILAPDGANPRVVQFFDTCLALYEAMAALPFMKTFYPFDIRAFQSDQLALAAFFGLRVAREPPGGRPGSGTVDGVKVAFFAAEDLNFPYQPIIDDAVLAQKFALHFKGGPAKAFARALAAPQKR